MIWVRGLKPRQRAINDCVDRKDGKNELATFRNIMNEWYAKDTSNKIKAVCGNYRSATNDCVSHYVKTSVLEAAILRAIQAVSKYVLENEAEFIDQLKVVWNEHQARASDNGQQELAEAKKRIADLDEKINKLYPHHLIELLS